MEEDFNYESHRLCNVNDDKIDLKIHNSVQQGGEQQEEEESQPSALRQHTNNTLTSEDQSYSGTLSSFSLGDVDDFLKEETKSIQTDSNNTDDDDNIAEEEMHLRALEMELTAELQNLQGTATDTPDRRKSESWVSHTPETNPQEEQDEDFASVAAESYQRPPSPPSTFEKFFLPFEATGVDTSTFALAGKSINSTNTKTYTNTTTSRKLLSSSILRSESSRTDDFESATEDISLTSDLDDISLEDTPQKSPIYNDILGQQTILEEAPEEHFNFDMAKRSKRTKNMSSKPAVTEPKPAEPTPTPTPEVVETVATPEPETEPAAPTPVPDPKPVEEKPKFDVVENVYGGAKSAWAFGKGIIVFKPFMGVAEGAAAKVLSMATGISSLEDADKQITCTLAGVDKDFIDPAILKLWSAIEPLIGKSDEVVKTVLGFVTTKVPLLKAE